MKQLSPEQTYCLNQIEAHPAEFVIGLDEVGAGPWAGPVTVCAAVVRKGWTHPLVRDSKEYKTEAAKRRRAQLALDLPNEGVLYHLVLSNPPEVIDSLGLRRARDECVGQAVECCLFRFPNAIVVMDGDQLPEGAPSGTFYFPKADALVPAVSAASVIAKEHRDTYMRAQHELYPWYGFNTNAGYGAEAHEKGLAEHGPCPIHRFSFGPLRKYKRPPPVSV